MLVVAAEEWKQIREVQNQMFLLLQDLARERMATVPRMYIPLKEFLAAVHIGRTKFDQLVAHNKIHIIKKQRKIYVPVSEIDRFFKDASIR